MGRSEIEQEKDVLYKQLYQQKREATLEKIKDRYPFLYWAKRYHLNSKGEELNFKDMYYLLEIYKNWDKWPLLSSIKSVQVGFSEVFIVGAHWDASHGMTVFYVLPKYEIRNRFVNNRISRLYKRADMYARLVKQAATQGGSNRTSLTHFGTGGIAFVGSNVEDEFAEIPVDSSYIDEYDRCNQKNILLVPDRLTASKYKFQREAGNPTIEGFGIDERFMLGTRSEWFIKCDHCGNTFKIDFFKHLVEEISPNMYRVRDPNFDPDSRKDLTSVICDKCHKPVNRLKKGEWVDEFPSKEWKTLRISGLMSKYVSMTKICDQWIKIGPNKTKQQFFFNSILGRGYSAEGAKVLDWMLDRMRRPYKYPCNPDVVEGIRTIGVDVGATLHFVIRERTKENGLQVRKLLHAGEVRNFKELAALITSWKPKRVVIDANPELHEVSSLKDRFPFVYSSRFQRDLAEMHVEQKDRIISMDRTAAMDSVKAAVDNQEMILPMAARDIFGGFYYQHMSAPTRLLDEDEENKDKSRFVWREGSKPDHLFLAEVYCAQADMLIPGTTVIDFYNKEINRIEGEQPKSSDLKTMIGTGDKVRLENLTPELFPQVIERTYTAPTKQRSTNDVDDEIEAVANNQLQNFGAIDLHTFSLAVGLNEQKAESFLLRKGFIRSQKGFVKDGA